MNRKQRVGRRVVWCVLSSVLAGCGAGSNAPSEGGERDRLITGKGAATRPAGAQDVGNMPMNLVMTPDGRHMISTDMGYHEALWSVRVADGRGVSHVDFSNDDSKPATRPVLPAGEATAPPVAPSSSRSNGLYFGLAATADGMLYAAQGAHDSIAVLRVDKDGSLALADSIATKAGDFPAGLAADERGHLYVSNNAAADGNDNPLELPGSVSIYDRGTKKELGRYRFTDSHFGTSNFPLGIVALRDGSKAYVAAERDDAVYALNTTDPSKPALAATVKVGSRPVNVLLTRDQRTLYVANSLSDTISVVDTASDRVTSTILLRPHMARDIPGVTPTALALSPDEKTLYVTLGDMNAVGVIDVKAGELQGYVATGWYPSALAVTPDGKRLLVASAKGHDRRNPNNMKDRHDPKRKASGLTVLEGNVSSVAVPSGKKLAAATEEVLRQNRLDALARPAKNPLASIGLASGKIKHVLYVIKENRTYDQVLGDMPQGNGDTVAGAVRADVTPNQHALAERFVLLDNLYACGEVSGDGWDWSTQGMANAYVIRNIPYNYSHRGRRFDEEGQNNGYPVAGVPAKDENGKQLWTYPAFRDGAKPIPDVANTGRNIWDAAREAGVSVRNFGFFSYTTQGGIGLVGGPDNYPAAPGLLPGGRDLDGVSNLDFRRFDMDYADSDAPEFYFKQTGDKACLFPKRTYGRAKSPSRFAEWNREFQMMLKKDPTGAAVPSLMLIRMPTDHGVGAKSGMHAIESYVADNDYGLGQIVEAVSKSPIWKETAIFVIEDDAQSGVDHVDAHRTTGFVISPWIKARSVDHRFYNTDSMLKTIELLLGLKPLSQYDAVADPILNWDTAPNNAAPFFATMPPKELVAKLNPSASSLAPGDPRRRLAEASDRMDFSHADAAPARELDAITWKLVRGIGTPVPAGHGWSASGDGDDD